MTLPTRTITVEVPHNVSLVLSQPVPLTRVLALAQELRQSGLFDPALIEEWERTLNPDKLPLELCFLLFGTIQPQLKKEPDGMKAICLFQFHEKIKELLSHMPLPNGARVDEFLEIAKRLHLDYLRLQAFGQKRELIARVFDQMSALIASYAIEIHQELIREFEQSRAQFLALHRERGRSLVALDQQYDAMKKKTEELYLRLKETLDRAKCSQEASSGQNERVQKLLTDLNNSLKRV